MNFKFSKPGLLSILLSVVSLLHFANGLPATAFRGMMATFVEIREVSSKYWTIASVERAIGWPVSGSADADHGAHAVRRELSLLSVHQCKLEGRPSCFHSPQTPRSLSDVLASTPRRWVRIDAFHPDDPQVTGLEMANGKATIIVGFVRGSAI
jgi:hypothetical protein